MVNWCIGFCSLKNNVILIKILRHWFSYEAWDFMTTTLGVAGDCNGVS